MVSTTSGMAEILILAVAILCIEMPDQLSYLNMAWVFGKWQVEVKRATTARCGVSNPYRNEPGHGSAECKNFDGSDLRIRVFA